jgi:replicative DNA helicase
LLKKPDFRPAISDLYQTGTLEKDADLIDFIYRDDVYYRGEDDSPSKGKAEIIIGKHRYGGTGTIMLDFNGSLCRFENIEPIVTPRPDDNLVHLKIS